MVVAQSRTGPRRRAGDDLPKVVKTFGPFANKHAVSFSIALAASNEVRYISNDRIARDEVKKFTTICSLIALSL